MNASFNENESKKNSHISKSEDHLTALIIVSSAEIFDEAIESLNYLNDSLYSIKIDSSVKNSYEEKTHSVIIKDFDTDENIKLYCQ